ncbi:MAG: hypothetical protein ACYS30_25940 [Planctomycetota bacterium]|jgi:hypothetical protein
MKRYLLFVFNPKKPVGGMRAFKKDYPTLQAAQKAGNKFPYHQIYDLEEESIVQEQEGKVTKLEIEEIEEPVEIEE